MTHARVEAGAVTAYPYSFRQMQLDNPERSFDAADPPKQAVAHGRYPVNDNPPPFDPVRQDLIRKDIAEWQVGANSVTITYEVVSRSIDGRKAQMIDSIENKRWAVEVGGMTFGGAPIPTDDRAKTLITGSYNAAIREGEAYSDEWKVAPGVYVTLDAATAIGLADALAAHIRASFAREKALTLAVLAAEDHDDLDLVEAEIDDGWPS